MNKVAYYDGVLGVYKRAGLQEEDLQRDALEAWDVLSPQQKMAVAEQVVADMEAEGSLYKMAGPINWFNNTVENWMANRTKGVHKRLFNEYATKALPYITKALPYVIGMGGGALAGGAAGGWRGALGGAALGGLAAYGYQRPETQNWVDKTIGNWNEKARENYRTKAFEGFPAGQPKPRLSSSMVPFSHDWRAQRAQEARDAEQNKQQ